LFRGRQYASHDLGRGDRVVIEVSIIKTTNQKLWIWFGLLAGIGLENKHSMLIWGTAITAGLLLTRQRQWFRNPWIWIAGLLAFLIFLPNLVWNYQHHFPFLELQANIRHSGRNVDLTPLSFFSQEVLSMHPMTLPIWLGGLWFFLFSKVGSSFRVFGFAWLFTAATEMDKVWLSNPDGPHWRFDRSIRDTTAAG
jgi:4-amino-4-deoxy-L-arabinose transferase-like glycosyltransferase